MRMTQYSPEQSGALREFVAQVGLKLSLTHRPFVDYYYASRDWCKLYLNVAGDGNILATYGLESMRFKYNDREMTIGFGSNNYSIKAGAGLFLFVYANDSCPVRLLFGGSQDSHKIVRSLGWACYHGVKVYVLNKPYEIYPRDSWIRVTAKSMARRITRSRLSRYNPRIPAEIRQHVSVREEGIFDQSILPCESPFTFRFAPPVDYLNWRYNTSLSFVRYRLFRILDGGRTAGYVVINETPERLIVAHCDGVDATVLAYGVLLSVLHVGGEDQEPRSVVLTSSHPAMQEIYQRFGFQPEPEDRPFFMGTPGGPVDIGLDTSNWLVNFDWGDNGLRLPFLDQPREKSPA
jgi:hypothetical protein